MDSRRQKIESFRALGTNWNSYGCEAFSQESIDAALELAAVIPEAFNSVMPIADGGVMFGKNGDDVTIEIYASEKSNIPADRRAASASGES